MPLRNAEASKVLEKEIDREEMISTDIDEKEYEFTLHHFRHFEYENLIFKTDSETHFPSHGISEEVQQSVVSRAGKIIDIKIIIMRTIVLRICRHTDGK